MAKRSGARLRSLVVFAVALAATAVSCADTTAPSEATGERREELFANDQTIYDYFVGKGLTDFQAAGIVGNLDQESGGDPKAVQPGGPGRGIAQWSVGGRWDHDANDNATAFATKEGQPLLSLDLQLDFVWYELTTFSGYGLASLKGSTNVTDATVAFQDKFEGCGTCDQGNRVTYAKAVLAAYGGPAAGYAAKFVSQTYPYAADGPVQLDVGQTVTGNLVMKNVGSKPWVAGVTKLAPIPRDQASPFQSPSWLTNARVSTIATDVAPGENGTFEWDLTGSAVGDFSPFFGFVEEGVTWFADGPDGGGPPDNDIQVHVVVAPAKMPPPGGGGSTAAGAGGSGDGGAAGASAGGEGGSDVGGSAGEDAGGSAGAAHGAGTGGAHAAGGSAGTGGTTGHGGGGEAGQHAASAGRQVTTVNDGDASSSGGCGVATGSNGSWLVPLAAAAATRARRRARGRRRSARHPF